MPAHRYHLTVGLAIVALSCTVYSQTLRNGHLRHRSKKPSKAVQVPRPVTPLMTALPKILPVTTDSEIARDEFARAMIDWENLKIDQAVRQWRAATQADSHFALAYLFLSYYTPDPVEEFMARERAKKLAESATPGEWLLIRWLTGVREDDYVPAIAAMNDLLDQFPTDKRLAFMAGRWLVTQEQYDQAAAYLRRATDIDSNYAAALNYLGYAYAFTHDYSHAREVMQRYVTLLPNEPNPEDSYAEILRMAGHYDEALEHYHAALNIDPKFHSSQLGIADTYAVMGNEKRARLEYFQARVLAPDRPTELQDMLQSALTYIREREFSGADQALAQVADAARKAKLPIPEAQAWRLRASLQMIGSLSDLTHPQTQKSSFLDRLRRKRAKSPISGYLQKALEVLDQADLVSESDRQDEVARILRVRAEWLAKSDENEAAEACVALLDKMTSETRSSAIRDSYEGASGGVFVYEGKYSEAISHLELDNANPFSIFRLAVAYGQTGNFEAEQQEQAILSNLNNPSAEQAFIAPAIRDRIMAVK